MKKIKLLSLAFLLTFLSACGYPEHYFTPEPECKPGSTQDFKEEDLIAGLKAQQPEDYRYFFKTFEEEGKHTFMVTNFRNEESCFDVRILVDKWDKLAGMKKTNGKSYPGELYDLKWEISSMNEKEVVKYVDMHEIVD